MKGCETCHGPGAAHVSEGGGKGVGGIIPLGPKSSTPAEMKSGTCLGCHSKGIVALWDGSAHEGRGIRVLIATAFMGAILKTLQNPLRWKSATNATKISKRNSRNHPITLSGKGK
jgi:hypothetical protein